MKMHCLIRSKLSQTKKTAYSTIKNYKLIHLKSFTCRITSIDTILREVI